MADSSAFSEMRRARRWLLWKSEPVPGGGKPRKVPYYANGNRRGATDTPEDRARLVSYDEAQQVLANGGGYTGLGFALGPDEHGGHWQGIDLDGIKAHGLGPLVRELPGYVEESPSGEGVHAIGYGEALPALGANASGVEVYAAGRFFTFTGQHVADRGLCDLSPVYPKLKAIHCRRNGEGPQGGAGTAGGKVAEGGRDNHLASMAGVMRRKGFEADAIFAALQAENSARCDPPLPDADVHRVARSVARYAPAEPTEQLASNPTEDDIALAFSHVYADRLRYVALWGRWLQWDGQRWVRDNTLGVYDAIRALLRKLGSGMDDKTRPKMLKAQTVAAVHNLVRADRRHAATTDQWDADDWLLNTPGGLVDLRTGETGAHDPAAHCTKSTAVAPADVDDCPRWTQFLTEVTAGDMELILFLQRLAGYSATGSVAEHMLAFLYGTGRNGKGVFLNTLIGVLKNYATVAGMDVFTEKKHESHPTELAALQGARMVIAQETEEGRRWNESRIKTLTGGDPITARYMHQDFFTFHPKFTLLIAGNHKPRLRTVDEAIASRLFLVPFTVTICKEKRDPTLTEKLRDEYPGIQRWIIDGCIEYQRVGLAPPEAVKAATSEYLQGEDLFTQWVADCCETGPTFWEPAAMLFNSWKEYAAAANERPGRKNDFGDRMRSAGFLDGRAAAKGGRHWNGLKLRPNARPRI